MDPTCLCKRGLGAHTGGPPPGRTRPHPAVWTGQTPAPVGRRRCTPRRVWPAHRWAFQKHRLHHCGSAAGKGGSRWWAREGGRARLPRTPRGKRRTLKALQSKIFTQISKCFSPGARRWFMLLISSGDAGTCFAVDRRGRRRSVCECARVCVCAHSEASAGGWLEVPGCEARVLQKHGFLPLPRTPI